jgi:putative alpha-1,2-mannosidase
MPPTTPRPTARATTSTGAAPLNIYLGYSVSEGWGPASTSIEYANADFATGNFAKLLGDNANGDRLITRAQSWKTLINSTGAQPVLQARSSSGAGSSGGMVEGTEEQYMWMVPYDLGGLVDILGGPKKTSDRLDKFFTYINAGQGHGYAYLGNEPSFTSPWVYNWAQNPAGTQKVVRRMINEVFSLKPNGLAGNDDLGSLSVKYVWGALGFYPEIPGVPGFAVHSPVFPKTTLLLADGTKKIVVNAPAAPATYVRN